MNAVLDPPVAPPKLDDEATGGGSEWVELIKAPNDIDAHLLAGRLEVAGIETRAIKDHKGPAWLYGGSDPWAPVAIWVRRFQLEDSRIVLAELSFAAPAATRAPEVARWKGAVVWWAAAIALGILFTGIGLMHSAESLRTCSPAESCVEP